MISDKFGFCVVGGDDRQRYLRQMLIEAGYRETQPADASIVILPIPCERQGKLWCNAVGKRGFQGSSEEEQSHKGGTPEGTLRQLSEEGVIAAGDLLGIITPGCHVYGGCFREKFVSAATERGILCYDFYCDEALTWKNAVATAEGTLAELIRCIPINVTGASGLIVGYGRCGKTMAAMLRPFGVKLRICARSEQARAEAGQYGDVVYPPETLLEAVEGVDFIINTVPVVLFTEEVLRAMRQGTPILDIASLPGGVEREAAEKLGIDYRFLPGLPGKVSPYTAALDMKEYILEREQSAEIRSHPGAAG